MILYYIQNGIGMSVFHVFLFNFVSYFYIYEDTIIIRKLVMNLPFSICRDVIHALILVASCLLFPTFRTF